MSNIKDIKSTEMQEIIDFYYLIEEYGHIFHEDPEVLDGPFKKILEGIEEIKTIMDDNYSF